MDLSKSNSPVSPLFFVFSSSELLLDIARSVVLDVHQVAPTASAAVCGDKPCTSQADHCFRARRPQLHALATSARQGSQLAFLGTPIPCFLTPLPGSSRKQ
ncbi:hypothetical protein EIP91_011149 [Steccherinum ochraceum]|uniref:Uncharacterized protein n=1 Tax=Steccherinum ochraceum TaxID=92696 RepID=A0A4R0RI87_9APHY|nr:hypothetical protein EIP91_011149 [Steccherinum ochraceum]